MKGGNPRFLLWFSHVYTQRNSQERKKKFFGRFIMGNVFSIWKYSEHLAKFFNLIIITFMMFAMQGKITIIFLFLTVLKSGMQKGAFKVEFSFYYHILEWTSFEPWRQICTYPSLPEEGGLECSWMWASGARS